MHGQSNSLFAGGLDSLWNLPDFMPHGYCYLWNPTVLWVNVISDLVITLAYYCIPLVLIYFARKNRDLPVNRMFWMFGAFILGCGTTHLMEVWNVWHGNYVLAGGIKFVTAVVSIVTAITLTTWVPKVISLPERMYLQGLNRNLQAELNKRRRFDAPTDAALRKYVTAGFMVAVIVTIAIGWSSWRGVHASVADADWVAHTYAVMDTLETTSKHLIEAGTSARAFAFSGEPSLLLRYDDATRTIVRDEAELRKLTIDNPSQERRIDALAKQMADTFDFAHIIITRRNQHIAMGVNEALEIERLMDATRKTSHEMRVEEDRLLVDRTKIMTADRHFTQLLSIVGIVIGVILLALGQFAVKREINSSRRAHAEVIQLNAQLETRVQERTADLQSEIAMRAKAEEALHASLLATNIALKELADQKFALDQHAIVAVTDVQGTIEYVNEKFCTISQYSEMELIGQNHRILNSGHHPLEFFRKMYHTIAGGDVWHGEIKNRAKDGSVYWVDTTIVPLVDKSFKPLRYIAIRADITARKLAEGARERLAAVVESSDDAIISKTTDGTITAWNRGAQKVFGYTATEVVGKPAAILIPVDRANEEPEILRQINLGESVENFETIRVKKDGSLIDVSVTISPIKSADGKTVGASTIARDITLRKRTEETLKQSILISEQALRDLADQKFALDQHAIVAVTDVQGTITNVNDKFCAISKYSRSELIGQNHRILTSGHHPREFFRQMYRTIARGNVWHAEICNRAKDGSRYWVDTTIVPFVTADGSPRQYVAIRADITERKMAEEQIRKLNDELEQRVAQRTAELAAANEELGAFTYSVSHDLRAPLRHMAGFSALLVEEFGSKLDSQARHYLQRIEDGTRKMGQLVDELLSLARVGRISPNSTLVDLNVMVDEVIAMLKPEWEGRNVEWRIVPLPSVFCDSTLMKQVFQNLIANALKYSRPRAKTVIELGATVTGEETVFFVRDNGVGFNMKYADKLFGVFQRLHRTEEFEGTGVGLATVQRILKNHGGRIWVEAELDKGATFFFVVGTIPSIADKSIAVSSGSGA